MGYNWRATERWRQHPLLTNNMRHAMPGFLLGAAAFGLYVLYDQALSASKPKKSH